MRTPALHLDLRRDEAVGLLDIAEDMAGVADREVKKLPTLRGRTVVNLFFEDSTRTRVSFEVAAKRLSADVINFSAKGSSVSKGESLKDTAQTLASMGADAVVIRHGSSGAPRVLAESGWIDAGVVNAGDGTHEHPTQALLDALRCVAGSTAMRRADATSMVMPSGDRGRHPALPRRPLEPLAAEHAGRSGHPRRTAHPPPVRIRGVARRSSRATWMPSSIPPPEVVMMLRVQTERMHDAPSSRTPASTARAVGAGDDPAGPATRRLRWSCTPAR